MLKGGKENRERWSSARELHDTSEEEKCEHRKDVRKENLEGGAKVQESVTDIAFWFSI